MMPRSSARTRGTPNGTDHIARLAFRVANNAAGVGNGFVFVRPINGTSDDWPRLMGSIVPAAIARGQTVVMLPGLAGQVWQCLSTVDVPSGAQIWGTPQTKINVNLAGVTAVDTPFTIFPGTLSSKTAMAVDVLPGATSITSPVTVPVNSIIVLGSTTAAQQMRYKVTSLSGGGPFTLGLDRPVVFSGFTVANGTTIATLASGPANVTIDGRGMLVTGVKAGGLASFTLAYRCVLRNVIFDATGMVFDAGAGDGVALASALENRLERVTVQSLAGTSSVSLATCESCVLEGTRASAGAGDGVLFSQSVQCTARDTIAESNALNGAHLSACTDCVLDGGSYNGNGGTGFLSGIDVDVGSAGTKIVNLVAKYNTGDGVFLDSSTTAVVDTFIDNVDAQNNSNSFDVSTGTLRTKLSNCDGSGCPFGMVWVAEGTIDQYTSVSATSTHQEMQLSPSAGLVIHARGIRIVSTQAVAILTTSSGLLHLSDVQVSMNAVGIAYKNQSASGAVTIDRLTVDGTATSGSTGISLTSGATVRLGEAIDVDLCTTPLSIGGSAFTSRGQFTANSTTPVSVAWAKLKTTDRVTTKVHTLGTVTVNPPEPLIIQTAGVGFTATSIATDTSVFDYTIL